MFGQVGGLALGVVGGLIGLAVVSVIVSRNAQAPTVISSAGSALAQVIGAAVSPVAGSGGNSFGNIGQTVGGVFA